MTQNSVALRPEARAMPPPRLRNSSSSARRNTSELRLRFRHHHALRSVCRLLTLLPLACQLSDALLYGPRMMHRAELGAAHATEFGALEVLGGKRLVVVFLSALRIETEAELLLPVERVARAGKSIIPVSRALPAARDVGGMRGDLVGDDALPYVFGVGKAQVHLGCHVAEHVRPEPADHRGADGAGDVIVAGRDVGDERAQSVERRLAAGFLHATDVHLDLIHRNVTGAFDHHLDIALPRAPGQLTKRIELGELRAVAGVGEAARAQAVAKRDGDVVVAKDVTDVVESLVEGILFAGR